MREKFWNALGTIPFVADGTTTGQISVLDTCGMHVKQKVYLKSNTAPDRVDLVIKRVLSSTDIIVGPAGQNINTYADVSAYLVADSATLRIDSQKKPNISREDREHAMYAEEPINARRVAQVDCYGDYYTKANPLPVDASISSPIGGQDVNIRDENGDPYDDSNPLSTYDAPESGGIYDTIPVTNVATPLRVGGSNLAGRRSVTVQPKGGTIYVGYDASVTTSSGFRLSSNSSFTLPKGDAVTIYGIKSGGGSVDVFVSEDA